MDREVPVRTIDSLKKEIEKVMGIKRGDCSLYTEDLYWHLYVPKSIPTTLSWAVKEQFWYDRNSIGQIAERDGSWEGVLKHPTLKGLLELLAVRDVIDS